MMPSNHLTLCHPLLLLPLIFPSIRVLSNELVLCISWPKCWSFGLSISPSNKYSELISFSIDWFDLLSVQGTQESSPGPTLWPSDFLLSASHPYITSGKTIALTIWFDCEVIFLFFNPLSRFVIPFLPRSKHLLISLLQSLQLPSSEECRDSSSSHSVSVDLLGQLATNTSSLTNIESLKPADREEKPRFDS